MTISRKMAVPEYETVSNCSGAVSGTVNVGGLVGRNDSGAKVSNCVWRKDASHGKGANSHIGGGEGSVTSVISSDKMPVTKSK